MSVSDTMYEKNLLNKLRQGDRNAFSYIFTAYYSNLLRFVDTFTKNPEISEEIVQDLFVRLWDNRRNLTIERSLKSYLLKTAQNCSLDWLRHMKVREKHMQSVLDHPLLLENDTEKYIFQAELEELIENALIDLPPELLQVFRLNRYEGKKYQEIADELHVSVRTVEVRISKALVIMREKLKDYLILLLLLWNVFGSKR